MQLLNPTFEDLYIDVRRREKRVLTDCQVMFLPDIDAANLHYQEWKIRKRSSQKLVVCLEKKNKPLKILEIGCGNGWLSSKLSAIPNTWVTGMDVNEIEIAQAQRIFKKDNLEFIWNSFDSRRFPQQQFDIIVFAASIQYFSSLKGILLNTLSCLSPNGEIHIIDSHFYKPGKVTAAIKRTADYYSELGYPEMAGYYFHHTLGGLYGFNYKILSHPGQLLNRINKSPFYWVLVKH
jgi:2-polyprenyl-3-methyl-5-hydroxy-6-metoxy-1,4-benzoquinol methylase